MKDEEIIKKAIEKAVVNGWSHTSGNPRNPVDLYVDSRNTYYRHIFSHSFAKAFWGEELGCQWCGEPDCSHLEPNREQERWQLELQQMVLEEQPLKYIEKYVDK